MMFEKIEKHSFKLLKALIVAPVVLYVWVALITVVDNVIDMDNEMIVGHFDLFLFTIFSVAIFNMLFSVVRKYVIDFNFRGLKLFKKIKGALK